MLYWILPNAAKNYIKKKEEEEEEEEEIQFEVSISIVFIYWSLLGLSIKKWRRRRRKG